MYYKGITWELLFFLSHKSVKVTFKGKRRDAIASLNLSGRLKKGRYNKGKRDVL